MELDLEEAAFGVDREVTVEVLDACTVCGGAGTRIRPPFRPARVPGLWGGAQVRRTLFGQFVQTGTCGLLPRGGPHHTDPCPDLRRAGRAYREKTLSVEIPAGIADGQRIRLTGQGGAGERGGRPGDLYVHVRVRAHELFERDGDDILYRRTSPWCRRPSVRR